MPPPAAAFLDVKFADDHVVGLPLAATVVEEPTQPER